MSNPYHVLGLETSADFQQVKTAFRTKSLALHPDKNPNGAEAFKEVLAAYEAIKDGWTEKASSSTADNNNCYDDDDVDEIIVTVSKRFGLGGDSFDKIRRDRDRAKRERVNISAYCAFDNAEQAEEFQQMMRRDSKVALYEEEMKKKTGGGNSFQQWREMMDADRRKIAEEGRRRSEELKQQQMDAEAAKAAAASQADERRARLMAEAEREWREIQKTL
eukprot:PhM_4_TR15848/c0_g1_i1/m.52566